MNRRPLRAVTEAESEAYRRDGVVLLKGMIDTGWIESLLREWHAISGSVNDPRQIYRLPQAYIDDDPLLREELEAIFAAEAKARNVYTEQAPGFIRCKYMHHWNPVFRAFLRESPAAEMVGRTIGAGHVRPYFDAMFVKEPGCTTKTYWHADHPAWPVKGEQVPTMWMPLLPVRAGVNCLEFALGSHRLGDGGWPNTYNAKKVGRPAGWPAAIDWEKRRDDPDYRIVSYDMEPGDAIIIHSRTHHGGGANLDPQRPRIALSTRWFGDDLLWDPRPECINSPGMPLHRMKPGHPIDNDTVFPIVWRRSDD